MLYHKMGRGLGGESTIGLPIRSITVNHESTKASTKTHDDGRSLRVLIVDDNVQAAESLAMIIGLWGHDSLMAYDGPRALEIASDYRPNVALVDIGLPGMDGFTLARRLRDSLHDDGLMIMAITGYGRDHEPQKSEEAGFDDHLIKPLDLEVLESRLLDLSNRRATRSVDASAADGRSNYSS